MPFGAKERVLEIIGKAAGDIFEFNKKIIVIGGEHLVSLPVIKEAYRKHPDLFVIHIDAHTDLRQEYMGETLSHSTVIRRVWDILGDGNIWQFGIRSGTREEFYWAKEGHTFMNLYNLDQLPKAIPYIGTKPLYLTIDLDVLDPSIFPGTGTPEAGGISFDDLMCAIKEISKLNIIGADIVELAPNYDHTGVSTAVACKVLRELVIAILMQQKR